MKFVPQEELGGLSQSRMQDLGRSVVLRRRLVARRRGGCALAAQALANFDEFYSHTLLFYRVHVTEEQDSQTPILDAILRFLKFLDESGILDLLLRLMFGLDLVEGASDHQEVWAVEASSTLQLLEAFETAVCSL